MNGLSFFVSVFLHPAVMYYLAYTKNTLQERPFGEGNIIILNVSSQQGVGREGKM